MAWSSFSRIITSTSKILIKCWHNSARQEWMQNYSSVISSEKKRKSWPYIHNWSRTCSLQECWCNQDCWLLDRKHRRDHFWMHVVCTDDLSKISLKSPRHSMTTHERTRNWFRRILQLRLWMSLILWNLGWWTLLCWPFFSCRDHTWSTPMHVHVYWELLPFTSKTTAIWMKRLLSATGSGHSIRRNKSTWQPKNIALLWYGQSSHCAHTQKGHHSKSKWITTLSSGFSHAMIQIEH